MLHRINLLFSIKGFDDNGKNGVGQTFQQVLTGNWIEIHDSWMTLSRKKPNPGRRWGQLLSLLHIGLSGCDPFFHVPSMCTMYILNRNLH